MHFGKICMILIKINLRITNKIRESIQNTYNRIIIKFKFKKNIGGSKTAASPGIFFGGGTTGSEQNVLRKL